MDRDYLTPEPSDSERLEWPDATHFYVQDLEENLAKLEGYVTKLRLFGWLLTEAVYHGTTQEQHDAAADLIKLMEGEL